MSIKRKAIPFFSLCLLPLWNMCVRTGAAASILTQILKPPLKMVEWLCGHVGSPYQAWTAGLHERETDFYLIETIVILGFTVLADQPNPNSFWQIFWWSPLCRWGNNSEKLSTFSKSAQLFSDRSKSETKMSDSHALALNPMLLKFPVLGRFPNLRKGLGILDFRCSFLCFSPDKS